MEMRQTAPETIREKLRPIEGGRFRFACHPGVSCFTECCRDLNLLLTPYDIVRLKNRLGLTSDEFLDRHADCRFDENRNLPMMYLRMNGDERRTCPFVSPGGCLVYGDRPSACRIYPVARASRVHRVHGTVLENYFVLREDHCLGFEEPRSWKIEEWLRDQGLEAYYRSNDIWGAILTHPAMRRVSSVPERRQMFYLASYDMDKFRRLVFGGRFLTLFAIPEETVAKMETDDAVLLGVACDWMKFSLLGEPALEARRKP